MSHQSELIAEDIHAYLAQHEQKALLRFITCGSVDDGKSTLIGRLLHDSKMIYEDQLSAVKSDSVKHGTTGSDVDLALLVDGLQAEREQGITIDVAYRYFSTAKRKFIIADTPGHEQYTRNMATGASTCDLAVILIDARFGVQTQTRRHSYIASLLGVEHVVVAVNKMDLLDFDETKFNDIVSQYLAFSSGLIAKECLHFVPISALEGDNVVNTSERCAWYVGPPLMEILENVAISPEQGERPFRFPVQYVNRPNLDFRGFCGTIASGSICCGDSVCTLPSGKISRVKQIVTYEGDLPEAVKGQAVTLTLEDEIDISRGDMIVKEGDLIAPVQAVRAHVVWMSEERLKPGQEYLFKFSAQLSAGVIKDIVHRIDVNTQEKNAAKALALNDIALLDVQLSRPVIVDAYHDNRATGAFVIIDRLSNVTVGAAMVVERLEGELKADNHDVFAVELSGLLKQHYPEKTAKEVDMLVTKLVQYL